MSGAKFLIRQWKTKLTSQNRLSLLSTFEVAARHLSFKLAADELHLHPVLWAIVFSSLKNYSVFVCLCVWRESWHWRRKAHDLLLTLTKSLRRIDDEIEDILYNDLRGTLTLGIAPILGQLWLIPRLPDFQQRWPSLNVMLRVRAGTVDFNEEQIDLAIYYGATRTFISGTPVRRTVLPVLHASLCGTIEPAEHLND